VAGWQWLDFARCLHHAACRTLRGDGVVWMIAVSFGAVAKLNLAPRLFVPHVPERELGPVCLNHSENSPPPRSWCSLG